MCLDQPTQQLLVRHMLDWYAKQPCKRLKVYCNRAFLRCVFRQAHQSQGVACVVPEQLHYAVLDAHSQVSLPERHLMLNVLHLVGDNPNCIELCVVPSWPNVPADSDRPDFEFFSHRDILPQNDKKAAMSSA